MTIVAHLLSFADRLRPAGADPCPLRPALWRIRPRPGPYRGRVGEGCMEKFNGSEDNVFKTRGGDDQGAARRPGEAPSLGAVDGLFYAAHLSSAPEVPRNVLDTRPNPPATPRSPPTPR